jgi:phosphoglycolate phosphatase
MPDLVMFDLEGTLVDTASEIAAALNAALATRGLPAVDEGVVRGWMGHGARELIRLGYQRMYPGSEPDADLVRAFEWHYAASSGRASRVQPRALEGLRALRARRIATAVVTNKETRFAAAVLHAHDLWQFLDAVVCGDMLEHAKPDPLGVEHCLARFRTAPGRALFAGESEIDVATARNAGVALCASIDAAARELEEA